MLKSYLIAPFNSGLQNDKQPFLIMEDAFSELEDMYVWRGRVRKRFGTTLIGSNDLNSRLRVNLGTTSGAGALAGTVPGTVFKVGQSFSIGSEVFTVNVTGAPATLLSTGAGSGTFNTTTGAFSITGASAATACYWYPSEPVMGLRTRENSSVNNENVIAFDTQFAYIRSAGGWERLDTTATGVWTGTNSSFFWSSNYRGANPYDTVFYTVNFTRADHIRLIAEGGTTFTDLRPQLDTGATRFLDSARMVLGYKDRLIALNCLETDGGGNRTYPSRCRFSQNGDPTAAATSWLDDTRGRGGYIDAPTQQQIISADIIKDRLIVYFERSTWELVYTGYPDSPFRWQQINNELGAESTFSFIGFDDALLGVGNVGIHSCNGVNVKRIDQQIPDEVYKIHNSAQGVERVYGIRDYVPELVYWTFPNFVNDRTFPNRVLVYNYKNGSYAFFNDTFTCFGYYQQPSDLTWATVGQYYPTWREWNTPWNSGRSQSAFPSVIAGNQQGFVLILDSGKSFNSQSYYITDMTAPTTLTIVDHNLNTGDYLLIQDCQGITSVNNVVVQVEVLTSNTISIDSTFSGTYTGGGKAVRVSQIKAKTKQFNPGTPVGQQFNFPYIDILLDQTQTGAITGYTFTDATIGDSIEDLSASGVLLGDSTISTSQENFLGSSFGADYGWHRHFIQASGQFIQLLFSYSDTQMRSLPVVQEDVEINAMVMYAEPQGRLI